jgi:23S rRNA pseudouridine2605 synthase
MSRRLRRQPGRHRRANPLSFGAPPPLGAERLQKVLAASGVGSRRDCEELIREGRVEVDRQVVTELGTRVDPLKQEIRVDGEALRRPQRLYFAVNKPAGVVTTNEDPSGRTRVVDLVPTEERVFAVGRLDRSSEGLILVTNDGEFANRLTHPRYGVAKTYLVRVAGTPTQAELLKLRRGIHLAEGVARVESLHVKGRHKNATDMVLVLREGKNREIRRILARIGHKVVRLKRIAIGRLKLADLPAGAWRRLAPQEVEMLLEEATMRRRERRKVRPGRHGGYAAKGAAAGSQAAGPPDLQEQEWEEEEAAAEPGEKMIEITGELMAPQARPPRGEVIEYDESPSSGPPKGPHVRGNKRQGRRGSDNRPGRPPKGRSFRGKHRRKGRR